MADYAKPCPVCQGPMYDQRAPSNKFPWVPGRPIAVCKRKKEGCTGVYWEPKKSVRELDAEEPSFDKPNATTKAAIAEAREKPSVTADVLDYFNILITVEDKFRTLVKDMDPELAATATFADLKEISTTIYIQRSKR